MKTQFLKTACIVGGMMMALAVSGAHAQIVGSKHDLSAGGTGQATTTATTEVCVFCHTPHGADVSAAVPLWNKVLNVSTYTQYSTLQTPTFDATELPVGSVSLACLSCHDGAQAMDVVINLPGSGGWSASGTQIDTGAIGAMTGIPVPMLGTDLTNDHPISMQYAAGGCTDADPIGPCTAALGDPDFNRPEKAVVNGNSIWWVNSLGGAGPLREKEDMILYTRLESSVLQPFVECGSCHDPHNSSSLSEVAPLSVAFLRILNTNSQICTACHIK